MALTRSKTAAFQLPGIHFSLGLSTVLLILNTKCILHSLLIFTADKQQHRIATCGIFLLQTTSGMRISSIQIVEVCACCPEETLCACLFGYMSHFHFIWYCVMLVLQTNCYKLRNWTDSLSVEPVM